MFNQYVLDQKPQQNLKVEWNENKMAKVVSIQMDE